MSSSRSKSSQPVTARTKSTVSCGPNSVQAAHPPAGIVSTPNSSDSEWVAVSVEPNIDIHTCRAM